ALAKPEPQRIKLVLHLCRKLCRSLSRKMPDPTKVATKAADKVFSSADFCNRLLVSRRTASGSSALCRTDWRALGARPPVAAPAPAKWPSGQAPHQRRSRPTEMVATRPTKVRLRCGSRPRPSAADKEFPGSRTANRL